MMNILFINHDFRAFDHLDSGASNRSALFINALSQVGHVDVVSFLDDEVSNICNCEVLYSKQESHSRRSSRFSKLLQLLSPIWPHLFVPLNENKQKVVAQYMERKRYDYIAIRYVNEAIECGLDKYKDILILDVDDNPRDVLLMQAKTAKTFRNKVFTHILSVSVDCMVKRVFSSAFCSFHSNPVQSPYKESVYLHNTTAYNCSIPEISNHTPLRLLVVGLFHYGPNKDGVNYFLQEIFPKIRTRNENIELHIVGKIPDEETKKLWECTDGVKVCGYVDDLVEEYSQARIVIVPIYTGSGTSVKVAEAMRMNRLCISTPQGIRGYDRFKNGYDYLLADSDELFVSLIIDSINKKEQCNRMAHNAKTKVEKYYSKDEFSRIVKDSIEHRIVFCGKRR